MRHGIRARDLRLRGLVGVLAVTSACAGGGKLEITVSQSAPHAVRLLAVYPTALRFEAPAYRSFELSMDEVDAVLAGGRFMVLGPDELEHLGRSSGALYSTTNLSGKLTALGLRPSEVAALRAWVEQREQRGSRQLYDPKGRPTGHSRSAEITYLVHADLIGPDSDEPLATGSLEVVVDPFAEHPPSDEAPELRQAVKRLTLELLHKAEPLLETRPQAKELPFEADWAPWNEERFSMPGRPALQARLAALDPVSAEAERLLRLSYFEPDLPLERQTRVLALPAGLLIRDLPSELRRAGLQAGDLITRVEGDPVAGRQTFLRWASAKSTGAPIHLTVLRGEQVVRLTVPAPSP